MALLRILAAVARGRGWNLVVATFDHRLRGDESAADRVFVEDLANRQGLPLRAGAWSDPAPGEAAARAARRAFLESVAEDAGAAAIALGHSSDDQAETVLHHLLRGAGARGLAGMRRWNPPYWRPLLDLRRADLRTLLGAVGQDWREDESNAGRAATRNRLRHDALPALSRALGRDVTPALVRAAALCADDGDALEAEARARGEGALVQNEPGRITIDRRVVAGLPRAISRRILRACGESLVAEGRPLCGSHLAALDALARAESPGTRLNLPRGITAHRKGRFLILSGAKLTADDADSGSGSEP